jgi:hypothetical protein
VKILSALCAVAGIVDPGSCKRRHALKFPGSPIPATAKKPHPIPPRHAFLHENEEERSVFARAPRHGLRGGGNGTNGALLRGPSRQSVGCAPVSIIFSRRTLDWVARAKRGRGDSWDRADCGGSSPRIRRAIFGWPASTEPGNQASSIRSQRSLRAGRLIEILQNRFHIVTRTT